MSKKELKPIDVSKYTVTESGYVIKSEEKETTKEDFFRQNFSEYCRGETFLSPYWDLFEAGYELKQDILSQHILELQTDKGRLTDNVAELEETKANLEYLLEGRDNEIDELKKENKVLAQNLEDTEICENGWKNRVKELEAQIEEMKCCGNCRWEEPSSFCDNCKRLEGQIFADTLTSDNWEIKEND